jgi:uncharacterized membrane protein
MSSYNTLLNGHGQHEAPTAGPLYDSSNILNVSREGRLASIVAGSLIASTAIGGITKHPFRSLARLAVGGYLLYRGLSGNCPISAAIEQRTGRHTTAINIRSSMTINKPREEVYAFWRQLGNLPLFMRHLEQVDERDSIHSRWIARGPGGVGTVEWEAEIVKEEPGSLLGWRSITGSQVATAGRVTFEDAANGGTAMKIMITYRPPAGYVGTSLAWLLNSAFERIVQEDIQRFKHFMETGAVVNEEKL